MSTLALLHEVKTRVSSLSIYTLTSYFFQHWKAYTSVREPPKTQDLVGKLNFFEIIVSAIQFSVKLSLLSRTLKGTSITLSSIVWSDFIGKHCSMDFPAPQILSFLYYFLQFLLLVKVSNLLVHFLACTLEKDDGCAMWHGSIRFR